MKRVVPFILALALLVPTEALGAISFGTSTAIQRLGATSASTTFTAVAGSVLFAFGANFDANLTNRTVSSITFGGANFTFVGSTDNSANFKDEIWVLVNPTTTANTVATMTMGGSAAGIRMGLISLTGVNTTTATTSFSGATCNGCTSVNATATPTTAGDWVLDVAQVTNGPLATSSVTQIFRWVGDNSGSPSDNAGSSWALTSTTPTSIRYTRGANDDMSVSFVGVRQASTTPAATTRRRPTMVVGNFTF